MRSLAVFAIALFCTLLLSCSSDTVDGQCKAGDSQACECPGGKPGTQACLPDRSGWAACSCDCGSCDDGDVCTDDTCDTSTGDCQNVVNTENSCDDGDACTSDDVCQADGGCLGTLADCDDDNDCTDDTCDSGTGLCQNEVDLGNVCSDLDGCTQDDACQADGSCQGTPFTCDDEDDCTDDTCDPGTGMCRFEQIDCFDDGDDTTTERCDPTYGCAHDWDNWTLYDSGWIYDHDTGLGWSPFVLNMTWDESVAYCQDLDLAGIGWTLPDIDQVRTLIDGCPNTEAGGPCPLDDPDCLEAACNNGVDCSSCFGDAGPNEGRYSKPGFFIGVFVIRSISVCPDCAGDQVWAAGFTNGNFHTSEKSAVLHFCCVVQL